MSKNKKLKHLAKANTYNYARRAGAISIKEGNLLKIKEHGIEADLNSLILKEGTNGITFGFLKIGEEEILVGMPEEDEGNVLVVGGNGSGKSRCIAMPTLKRWGGAICATDLKGELSERYGQLYQSGSVTRPYLVFDPAQAEGPSYDPFWWLLKDAESSLVANIWEISLAIIPTVPEDNQPFWIESEQALFAASLLFFFKLGLSFSEAVCEILGTSISSLCEKLAASEDIQVRMLLGNPTHLKADVLAAIDRGLRNKLVLFANDPYISHAFRGRREGAECFTWDDLEHINIFLRIPADKVEQWGGAINLILTQLLHYLERRPEKYRSEAERIPQTLLLLDEFVRFGKLDMLPAAMATLRSKKVNICLLAQSIAQIDAIYGVSERRIILDNCQVQAILRANDPETQEALCKLIGTRIQKHYGVGQQLDSTMNAVGYSIQISEVRDWMVCPHELATLEDVLLLTPHGFLRVQKLELGDSGIPPRRLTDKTLNISCNKGATMLMIEERMENARERIQAVEYQRRVAQKQASDSRRRQEDRLKYILGSLLLKYFPELSEIVPRSTQAETQEQFHDIEVLLAYFSNRRDLVHRLQTEARAMTQSAPKGINV